MPRLLPYGPNGDDTDLLVLLNYDMRATITLMVDGNASQSSKPVECSLELSK